MGEMADYYIEQEMDRWFDDVIWEDYGMAKGYFNDNLITEMDYQYLGNAIGWCNERGYEDKAKELSAERLRRDFGESACESASTCDSMVLKEVSDLKKIEAWKTDDGKVFEYQAQAQEHQRTLDLRERLEQLFQNVGSYDVDIVAEIMAEADELRNILNRVHNETYEDEVLD